MANLNELYRYVDYQFSTGVETGAGYKSFERKYINYLKSIAKEYGWNVVNVGKNHYEFSLFFENNGKFVYVSISDVRYFKNEFWNRILYRTAKSEKDYTGGRNCYTNIGNLKYAIYGLLGGAA